MRYGWEKGDEASHQHVSSVHLLRMPSDCQPTTKRVWQSGKMASGLQLLDGARKQLAGQRQAVPDGEILPERVS